MNHKQSNIIIRYYTLEEKYSKLDNTELEQEAARRELDITELAGGRRYSLIHALAWDDIKNEKEQGAQ